MTWLKMQHKRGKQGTIMFDIDDTLINGRECVTYGFEYMKDLFDEMNLMFPIHIVTARPDDQHDLVTRMLKHRGFCIPTDRLHMLPSDQYDREDRDECIIRFKFETFKKMKNEHGRVLARFGDRKWDVAHIDTLRDLKHVDETDCCVFIENGCLCVKLPGSN